MFAWAGVACDTLDGCDVVEGRVAEDRVLA
jgi:hypothetical protein